MDFGDCVVFCELLCCTDYFLSSDFEPVDLLLLVSRLLVFLVLYDGVLMWQVEL